MSFNTFGKIFRFTTWGESHGPAIGCVIDGCPPNIPLSENDIQKDMDRRRPGQSKFTTQRKETDKVSILSGRYFFKCTLKISFRSSVVIPAKGNSDQRESSTQRYKRFASKKNCGKPSSHPASARQQLRSRVGAILHRRPRAATSF